MEQRKSKEQRKPITTATLRNMKTERNPISVITAYDYPSAKLAEEAGIDVILVGDSLGNVILGYDSTIPVTLEDMLHHTKAVTRAVSTTFVVTDLPFMTYHGNTDQTLRNAGRLMQEGLCKAVKMEGGAEIVPAVEICVRAGIPIMGHLGLTPQSVHQLGGYRVQGRSAEQAEKLLADAKAIEQAGAFALVLELVPEEVAGYISTQISIPTIGIGAGRGCDGQVLVFHDLLQYGFEDEPKKFVKHYASIGEQIRNGIAQYVSEVKERSFPQEGNTFKPNDEVIRYLNKKR